MMAKAGLRHWLATQVTAERVRFLLVGIYNTAFGYLVFLIFLRVLDLPYILALVIAHLIAVTNAFVTYRKGVFQVSGRLLGDLARFQLVYVGQFALNAAVLVALVQGVGMSPTIAQGLTVISSALIGYFGHKHFSFARRLPLAPYEADNTENLTPADEPTTGI